MIYPYALSSPFSILPLSNFIVLGSHLVVLRGQSWLCAQGSLMVVFRGPCDARNQTSACKTCAQSVEPLSLLFLHCILLLVLSLPSDFIIPPPHLSLFQEIGNMALTVVMDSLGHRKLKPKAIFLMLSSKRTKQAKKRAGSFVIMEIVSNMQTPLWLVLKMFLCKIKSKQADCCMDSYPSYFLQEI